METGAVVGRLLAAAICASALHGPLALADGPRKVVIIQEAHLRDEVIRWNTDLFREQGWAVGENLSIVHANLVELQGEAVDRRAHEIVASKPDVILIDDDHVALFKRLTKDIPLVFVNLCCDPVRLGFVQSLGRPGGNITGTVIAPVHIGKGWEIAMQLRPRLKRLATLHMDDVPREYLDADSEAQREAAARLRLELVDIALPQGTSFAEVERRIRAARVDAVDVSVPGDIAWLPQLRSFLPAAGIIGLWDTKQAREGGLLGGQAGGPSGFRDAVKIADRILRGAKPAEIPVQMNRSTSIAINLRTAKAMNIEVPPSVLVLADIVIR